jgi:hypothetical protein
MMVPHGSLTRGTAESGLSGSQTRKSPIPVPPIPDLAGNREFPPGIGDSRRESGIGESPIPDSARSPCFTIRPGPGIGVPMAAGRGFPGLHHSLDPQHMRFGSETLVPPTISKFGPTPWATKPRHSLALWRLEAGPAAEPLTGRPAGSGQALDLRTQRFASIRLD